MLCTLKITLAPSFLTTSTTASAALPQRAPKMGKIFQIILYYKILQNMYLSIYEDSFGSNILRVCSCALSIPTPRAIILILFWLWIPNIHRSLQIGTVLVFFMKYWTKKYKYSYLHRSMVEFKKISTFFKNPMRKF